MIAFHKHEKCSTKELDAWQWNANGMIRCQVLVMLAHQWPPAATDLHGHAQCTRRRAIRTWGIEALRSMTMYWTHMQEFNNSETAGVIKAASHSLMNFEEEISCDCSENCINHILSMHTMIRQIDYCCRP